MDTLHENTDLSAIISSGASTLILSVLARKDKGTKRVVALTTAGVWAARKYALSHAEKIVEAETSQKDTLQRLAESAAKKFGVPAPRIVVTGQDFPIKAAGMFVTDNKETVILIGPEFAYTADQHPAWVEAVFAHELAHQGHQDALHAAMVGDITTLTALTYRGLRNTLRGNMKVAAVCFGAAYAYRHLSGYANWACEYEADRIATEHGYGPDLIEALTYLGKKAEERQAPPLVRRNIHPPIADRIAKIRELTESAR